MVETVGKIIECPVCVEILPEKSIVTCLFCGFDACKTCIGKYVGSQRFVPVRCIRETCNKPWPLAFGVQHFGARRIYEGDLSNHWQLANVRHRLDELDAEIKLVRRFLQKRKIQEEKIDPLCPCPQRECDGLVEKTSCKCHICRTELCKKCHMVREKNHACRDQDRLTIALLHKDTKACPVCAVPIYKIKGGCDQMWCTQCRTAFNWKTRKLDKGSIHNPHALRYWIRWDKIVLMVGLYYWWAESAT